MKLYLIFILWFLVSTSFAGGISDEEEDGSNDALGVDVPDAPEGSTIVTEEPSADAEVEVSEVEVGGSSCGNDPWRDPNRYGPQNNYVSIYLHNGVCRDKIRYNQRFAYIYDDVNPKGWRFSYKMTPSYDYQDEIDLRMKGLGCVSQTHCTGKGSYPEHYKPHVEVLVKYAYKSGSVHEKLFTFTDTTTSCWGENRWNIVGESFAWVQVAARCKYSVVDKLYEPMWFQAPYGNANEFSIDVVKGWSKTDEVSTTKGHSISTEVSSGVEAEGISASTSVGTEVWSETTMTTSNTREQSVAKSQVFSCPLAEEFGIMWWEYGWKLTFRGNVRPSGFINPVYYHKGQFKCTFPFNIPCCVWEHCDVTIWKQCFKCQTGLSGEMSARRVDGRMKYCGKAITDLSPDEITIVNDKNNAAAETAVAALEFPVEATVGEEDQLTAVTSANKQCSKCAECGWDAEDKAVQGYEKNLTLEGCYRECLVRGYECHFFAYAAAGKHCHMFATCNGKNSHNPTSWERYKVHRPAVTQDTAQFSLAMETESDVGAIIPDSGCNPGTTIAGRLLSYERAFAIVFMGSIATYLYANRNKQQKFEQTAILLEDEEL